ncbi:hypothetical protein VP01_308g2 [Puccinia sorghi]|uniref:Uncharacterized protein n=1 Tax=Puccinia sorghi TaxID=27349 RepID=A0A0L6UZJ0_9BASI|nr:hypothetical protein VP01_308g2 [Puccinia sorghi]
MPPISFATQQTYSNRIDDFLRLQCWIITLQIISISHLHPISNCLTALYGCAILALSPSSLFFSFFSVLPPHWIFLATRKHVCTRNSFFVSVYGKFSSCRQTSFDITTTKINGVLWSPPLLLFNQFQTVVLVTKAFALDKYNSYSLRHTEKKLHHHIREPIHRFSKMSDDVCRSRRRKKKKLLLPHLPRRVPCWRQGLTIDSVRFVEAGRGGASEMPDFFKSLINPTARSAALDTWVVAAISRFGRPGLGLQSLASWTELHMGSLRRPNARGKGSSSRVAHQRLSSRYSRANPVVRCSLIQHFIVSSSPLTAPLKSLRNKSLHSLLASECWNSEVFALHSRLFSFSQTCHSLTVRTLFCSKMLDKSYFTTTSWSLSLLKLAQKRDWKIICPDNTVSTFLLFTTDHSSKFLHGASSKTTYICPAHKPAGVCVSAQNYNKQRPAGMIRGERFKCSSRPNSPRILSMVILQCCQLSFFLRIRLEIAIFTPARALMYPSAASISASCQEFKGQDWRSGQVAWEDSLSLLVALNSLAYLQHLDTSYAAYRYIESLLSISIPMRVVPHQHNVKIFLENSGATELAGKKTGCYTTHFWPCGEEDFLPPCNPLTYANKNGEKLSVSWVVYLFLYFDPGALLWISLKYNVERKLLILQIYPKGYTIILSLNSYSFCPSHILGQTPDPQGLGWWVAILFIYFIIILNVMPSILSIYNIFLMISSIFFLNKKSHSNQSYFEPFFVVIYCAVCVIKEQGHKSCSMHLGLRDDCFQEMIQHSLEKTCLDEVVAEMVKKMCTIVERSDVKGTPDSIPAQLPYF